MRPSDDTFRCSPVFDVPYVDHNERVDLLYVGIAAAARALDGMRIRAFPNALHCLEACCAVSEHKSGHSYVFVISGCEHAKTIRAFTVR